MNGNFGARWLAPEGWKQYLRLAIGLLLTGHQHAGIDRRQCGESTMKACTRYQPETDISVQVQFVQPSKLSGNL
jgi:hypothetical protein